MQTLCKKLLEDIVGIGGYEQLEKAIYRSSTQHVADPLELYLPLLVVPRAILSWLSQNIQPMKIGEHKEMKFPGRDDVAMHVEKQNSDTYKAEFVKAGKIIHTIDKSTLPSFGGHLMTVFEQYGHLHEPDKKEEAPKEIPALEVPKAIMEMSGIPDHVDSEEAKWAWSHANVKELSGVIGKLVDALVGTHKMAKEVSESFDKKELPGDKQEIKKDKTPAEQLEASDKSKEKDKSVKIESRLQNLTNKIRPESEAKKAELSGDKQKVEKDKTPAEQLENSDKAKKADPSVKQPSRLQDLTNKILPEKINKAALNPAAVEAASVKPVMNMGRKLLRRKKSGWGNIPHGGPQYDQAKGPQGDGGGSPAPAPAPAAKAEMPSGAAMAKKPQGPQMPKPPSPPSNKPPKAQAQSQASAKGTQPKPPKMNMQISGQAKMPKMTMKSEKSYHVTVEEMYSPCFHCGKPEFQKGEDGSPKFQPCYCFAVLCKNESGNKDWFVNFAKADAGFRLTFNPKTDSESVYAFLHTLKSRLTAVRDK